jgi:hypothetical protein
MTGTIKAIDKAHDSIKLTDGKSFTLPEGIEAGLISAIYINRIAGEGEREAEGQLSFYYGHVAIPVISQAWPMDVSWEDLEEHFERKS